MLNQVVLVGRLTSDVTITNNESGKEHAILTLAVNRSYKNADGIYETDFVDCILWDTVATNVAEYCKKGDVVGVKGRLQTQVNENENGEKTKVTQVVAEKVTFLSSRKPEDKEEE